MPRSHRFGRAAVCLAILGFAVPVTVLQSAEPARINPEGIPGALVLVGGGRTPSAAMNRFLELAGGDKAHLVVIPTADLSPEPAPAETLTAPWTKLGFKQVSVLHTRDREQANQDDFVRPLTEATAVWFDGGSQDKIAAAYLGTAVERELLALLQRGGVIGGTSAGAAIQCRVMIARNNPVPDIETGFDLLPRAVIDQHFTQRKRAPRLQKAIQDHPGLFGLGIDESTAVIIKGREMRVVGDNQATIYLGPGAGREERFVHLEPDTDSDLVLWQRAALDRTLAPFPPQELAPPRVEQGSLVIVGGGGLTPEIIQRFIDLAGGLDAPIVVLPTAQPGSEEEQERQARFLQRAGCKNVRVLPQHLLADVNSQSFLSAVNEARGVWFGGGRQWRFVDAYAGTPAVEAFRGVLARGGVIGGSSAGATIQGDFLVRGSPLGNLEMMCEGYERGFAFLPGTAIDQHFTQRKRQPDMTAVVDRFPQLLGIGIDETTALIVHGSVAEIMGANQAHFYDRNVPKPADGEPDYVSLPAGSEYDLAERKVLKRGEVKQENSEERAK